jgi:ribosome-binding protein aMBF1 (putative translation factor)
MYAKSNRIGGTIKLSYPELLRKARQSAGGLSTRQLKTELEARGVQVSVTFINQVENAKVKPTFDFAYSTAEATGLQIEEALRSAFLYRVRWCVDREREQLRILAEEKGLSSKDIDRITALKLPGA